MSGEQRRPATLQRAHLEALFVAHAVLDPTLVDAVDRTRLSRAANTVLDAIDDLPNVARVDLVTGARLYSDDAGRIYAERLAERAVRLTLTELTWWPVATLVALVDRLPVVSGRVTQRAA